MSEERIAIEQAFSWADRALWSVVFMFMAGTLGRALISNEPFCARRFFGEMILSCLGAITLYSLNLMQGMTPIQIIFFGALGSMGGVRMIEWVIKFAKKVKSAGIL